MITDGWKGYHGIAGLGYAHVRRSQRAARARGEDAGERLPGVHRVASLAKRWLLGTHQGSVEDEHLQSYLNGLRPSRYCHSRDRKLNTGEQVTGRTLSSGRRMPLREPSRCPCSRASGVSRRRRLSARRGRPGSPSRSQQRDSRRFRAVDDQAGGQPRAVAGRLEGHIPDMPEVIRSLAVLLLNMASSGAVR